MSEYERESGCERVCMWRVEEGNEGGREPLGSSEVVWLSFIYNCGSKNGLILGQQAVPERTQIPLLKPFLFSRNKQGKSLKHFHQPSDLSLFFKSFFLRLLGCVGRSAM